MPATEPASHAWRTTLAALCGPHPSESHSQTPPAKPAQSPAQAPRPQRSHGLRSRSRRCTPSNPSSPAVFELSNGPIIFLQEDHELPFINGSILIRGGSRNEPAVEGRHGVASTAPPGAPAAAATTSGDTLDYAARRKGSQHRNRRRRGQYLALLGKLQAGLRRRVFGSRRPAAAPRLQGGQAPTRSSSN